MTALAASSTAWSITNPSQSTAPVLEFRCLYTSDLRRKQKRWQDGRLKYHTFNKRVMLYDEMSNYVGDTHWRREYNFNEGEEVELERGGILVQVAECVGRRDQDLSELTGKRAKEREQRIAGKSCDSTSSPIREHVAARTLPISLEYSQNRIPKSGFIQLRSKSLNSLLGTPSNRHSRALAPTVSPFEIRRREQDRDESKLERQPKRRKLESPPTKNGYAKNLTGATLSLSARPVSTSHQIDPLFSHKSTHEENAEILDFSVIHNLETSQLRIGTLSSSEKPLASARQKGLQQMRHGFSPNLSDEILELDPKPSESGPLPVSIETKLRSSAVTIEESRNARTLTLDGFIDHDVYDLPKGEGGRVGESRRVETTALHAELTSKVPIDHERTSNTCAGEATNNDANRKKCLQGMTPIGQNVSALRIKSKPKKTLLFLSRVQPDSLHNEKDGNFTGREVISIQDEKSENPWFSLTTTRPDEFEKTRQHQLQTRLNVAIPLALNEEHSSSWDVTGIDHRTIDELLSRDKSLQSSKMLGTPFQLGSKVVSGNQQPTIRAPFAQEQAELKSLPISEIIVGQDQAITGINRVQAILQTSGKTSNQYSTTLSSLSNKAATKTISLANFANESRITATEQIVPNLSPTMPESESHSGTGVVKRERSSNLDSQISGTKILPQRSKSNDNCWPITQLPSCDSELKEKSETSKSPELVMGSCSADSKHIWTTRQFQEPARDQRAAPQSIRAGKSLDSFGQVVSTTSSPPLKRFTMTSKTPPPIKEDGFSGISEGAPTLVAHPKSSEPGAAAFVDQGEAPTTRKVIAQRGNGPWSAEAYDLMDWRPHRNTSRF